MPNVVFVVPFAMASSLRFVRAAALLPGVRLALITQDAVDTLPQDVRHLLAGFLQLADALDADALTDAVRALGRRLGSVDALLGVLEPLQEPLALVRERLRIGGMDHATAGNFRDKARMKAVLREHGLPCAAFRLCTSAAEGLALAPARRPRCGWTTRRACAPSCSRCRRAPIGPCCSRSSCAATSSPSTR
jgi:hypothetical protein